MPSLSSFLKSSRLSQQIDPIGQNLQNGTAEKAPSRRRAFFNRLLKRSSVEPQKSSANKVQKDEESVNSPSPKLDRPIPSPSNEQPSTTMSNSNKPLPPPPPTGDIVEPAPKPTIKLDRIIAPLKEDDIQKLFLGAPQFSARSTTSHKDGTPQAFVTFPYNTESSTNLLTDHVVVSDEAWTCVTAWLHTNDLESSQPANFVSLARERPSMLSLQGLERGTVGFQAALEIGVADALQIQEEPYDSKSISEHRWKALNGKSGVRPLTDSALIERLTSVAEVYHEDPHKPQRPSIELYTDLFTQILHPPSRVTDLDDPYSLPVQIEALDNVLRADHLWFDFSKVEWRIRLGQLLWSSTSDLEEEVHINNEEIHEPTTQKYWLLLQILLSCELLLRLDKGFASTVADSPTVKSEFIQKFEKNATPSVNWSLLLARQWLDNIRIQKPATDAITEEKPVTGWLASLTGSSQPQQKEAVQESINDLKFEGRHQARQARGLVHFARKLQWPNTENIVTKVTANGITISEITGDTPIGTPRSVSTQRSSSYFSKRPGLRRGLSSINDRVSAIIHPAGWLSNSYISGLILPGESLSHFLISTLLENDAEAVAKLGEEANLYGGFVYQSKSFWSTSCLVGRILAAGKGSRECLGWISSNVLPRGVREEWIEVDVEPLDEFNPEKREKRPRILRKATIEQRGNIIGGADTSSVLPGDFILPSDEPSQSAVAVKFESLDLFATDDSIPATPVNEDGAIVPEWKEPPQIKVYSAMMRFTLQLEEQPMKEINLSLSHDVYFLSAHPCLPSRSAVPVSPTSPSFRPSPAYKASESSGHPLHKAFTYTKVPLSHILTTSSAVSFNSLLSPPSSPNAAHFSTHTTSSSIPKVLVIDCTDSIMDILPHQSTVPGARTEQPEVDHGSDPEMLGRALCAERGWNALISRRGRGCLGCAVREAGAVGWRVILRVA